MEAAASSRRALQQSRETNELGIGQDKQIALPGFRPGKRGERAGEKRLVADGKA